jgi:hypothetical protein
MTNTGNQKVCNYYGEALDWGSQDVAGGWFTPDSFKDKVGSGFTTHFMSPDGSIWTYESLKLGPMGDPEGKMVMVAPPDALRVRPKPIGSDWPTLPDLENARALSTALWYLPPVCYMPASGAFTFAGFINFQPVVASAAFPGLHFQLDEVWPTPHAVEMDAIPLISAVAEA